ncbi:uncharacterized protein LOC124408587 [Diprion similis]|uniref:uncharacterized protein LOC124408587 n=1 Tax=Diprion similis TaxID=362088 RepID=UPI001EF8AFC0|nr:uncharacterized protein LOC124408587 [Diprion similis]
MLRSKATAALMKLKEIDRKYKMKCSEDHVKRQGSLSDISAVDSADEVSKPAGASGAGDAIARPKLDVRMPDAHLEPSEGRRGQGAELVTIFDYKSGKKIPLQESANYQRADSAAGEAENQEARKRSETPSLQVESERESAGKLTTETSISEEVPEVVRPTTPFSRPVSDHLDVPSLGEEITMKSVESIIDGDERPASTLDADSPILMASAGYSDDFVRSTSSAKTLSIVEEDLEAQEPKASSSPSGSYRPQRSSPTSMQSETKKLTELVAPKVIRVLSKCDVGLDPELSDYVKATERRASTNGNTESPVRLLRSSPPSTDRSDEIRRTNRVKRRTRTAISSRDSSGLSSKEDSETEKRNDGGIIAKQEETVMENRRIVFLMEGRNLQSTTNSTDVLQKYERGLEKAKSKSVRNRTRIEAPVSLVEEPDLQTRFKDWEKEENVSAAVQQPEQVPPSDEASAVGGQFATSVGKPRSKKPKIEERHRAGKSRTKADRKKPSCGSAGVEEESGAKRVAGDVERLRRRLKELLLEQEREQLRPRVRRYLQQMMDEDDGFGDCAAASSSSGLQRKESLRLRSVFKPLDLPNVAAFKRPDFEDDKIADLDCESRLHLRMIHERVLEIRHWLKQQFVLYRDYSNLASTINASYIPVTLKETKKMIRETQRFRDIIIRERRCHVT